MRRDRLELIKRALTDAQSITIKRVESIPYPTNVEYSNEYNQKIENLKKIEVIETAPVWSMRKIVAVIIAAALIFAMSVTAIAFKGSIKEFFIKIYETVIQITTNPEEEDPKTIETAYTIYSIPDGFEMVDEYRTKIITELVWMRGEEDMIIFNQTTLEGNSIGIDGDNADYTEISIDGNDVFLVYSEGMYVAMWIEHRYLFTIICSDSVSFDVIEDMIASLDEEIISN